MKGLDCLVLTSSLYQPVVELSGWPVFPDGPLNLLVEELVLDNLADVAHFSW
jgi:hypothetical protein